MIRKSKLLPVLSIMLSAFSVASIEAGETDQHSSQRIRTLLVPANETVISSQLAGQIVFLKEQIGSSFKQDEQLVRFDCGELNARLAMAEAEQDIAAVTLKAKQDLFNLQSAGETEVALAVAAATKAKAQVTLQTALKNSCEIKAPFDGYVVKVSARAFQSVNQGQSLLEIVSSKPPKAKLNLPSKWLGWLKPGARFSLNVDETGRSYSGRITSISAKVDAVSQTVEAEGEIEATASLLAGMSGYATFKHQPKAH